LPGNALIKFVTILLVLQVVILTKPGNPNAGVVRVCLVFPYSLLAAAEVVAWYRLKDYYAT
jgi:hypothetical protein